MVLEAYAGAGPPSYGVSMKPLPQGVQDAFPCRTNAHHKRPWWDKPCHPRWCSLRRDGKGDYHMPMEYIDSEHPLPHPGYRAGQVWAAEDGSSVVITNTNQVTDSFCHDYPYLMADPSCPWLAPWSPAEDKS